MKVITTNGVARLHLTTREEILAALGLSPKPRVKKDKAERMTALALAQADRGLEIYRLNRLVR